MYFSCIRARKTGTKQPQAQEVYIHLQCTTQGGSIFVISVCHEEITSLGGGGVPFTGAWWLVVGGWWLVVGGGWVVVVVVRSGGRCETGSGYLPMCIYAYFRRGREAKTSLDVLIKHIRLIRVYPSKYIASAASCINIACTIINHHYLPTRYMTVDETTYYRPVGTHIWHYVLLSLLIFSTLPLLYRSPTGVRMRHFLIWGGGAAVPNADQTGPILKRASYRVLYSTSISSTLLYSTPISSTLLLYSSLPLLYSISSTLLYSISSTLLYSTLLYFHILLLYSTHTHTARNTNISFKIPTSYLT